MPEREEKGKTRVSSDRCGLYRPLVRTQPQIPVRFAKARSDSRLAIDFRKRKLPVSGSSGSIRLPAAGQTQILAAALRSGGPQSDSGGRGFAEMPAKPGPARDNRHVPGPRKFRPSRFERRFFPGTRKPATRTGRSSPQPRPIAGGCQPSQLTTRQPKRKTCPTPHLIPEGPEAPEAIAAANAPAAAKAGIATGKATNKEEAIQTAPSTRATATAATGEIAVRTAANADPVRHAASTSPCH